MLLKRQLENYAAIEGSSKFAAFAEGRRKLSDDRSIEGMSKPVVTLIVARAANGVIGRDGGLPWHISADLKHFKKVTMGTRDGDGPQAPSTACRAFCPGGGTSSSPATGTGQRKVRKWRIRSRKRWLWLATEPVSVIGGAEIFELFMPHADRLELTEVIRRHTRATQSWPTRAPNGGWREVAREEHAAEGETPAFAFVTLERA